MAQMSPSLSRTFTQHFLFFIHQRKVIIVLWSMFKGHIQILHQTMKKNLFWAKPNKSRTGMQEGISSKFKTFTLRGLVCNVTVNRL